jgi:hypothetical protein
MSSSPTANAAQLDLAMNVTDLDPSSESALRAAWRTLSLSRRLPFDQAMQNDALAICIRGRSKKLVAKLCMERK